MTGNEAMNLRAGKVTFLFTDIEGSTRMWEEHPEQMRAALSRHDAILCESMAQRGGAVFKATGDGFCAAFFFVADAIGAALDAQRALTRANADTDVEAPARFLVRMAVHTGAAELRDGDYYGPPLNRAARLLAVGHGGQILLSEATRELAVNSLPEGTSLKPLGEHRLRDLLCPEKIFQLLAPDLPAEFPRLRTLEHLPNNIPQQLTSFVGREKEIAEVKRLLATTRLLTLTGSGGCGKTRLALQAAADVFDEYPDGVWLVELAPLADPDLVAKTVAQALSVREEPGEPVLQTLVRQLKPRKALLLLDNCEHLLDACAHLAAEALLASPNLRILASSREGLGISGEQSYRVPSLSLPDPKRDITIESVSRCEAVSLFADRARLSDPHFAITVTNAAAVGAVCRRLDGMPLAIELAAARVKSLSVEELNARLDQRFRLLTGGSRTALPRQQTLRSLIDWSYELLNDQAKLLFRGLSVFSGGLELEAAEQVCSVGGIEDWEVMDLLTGLVEKSLVVADVKVSPTRYSLLETIRQYARDRLLESAEGISVRDRHRDYFLGLAEDASPNLSGGEGARWLNRLEREHDNFRSALEWSSSEPAGLPAGLRLAAALSDFWESRGHAHEGRRHVELLLAETEALPPTTERARALGSASSLASAQNDYASARKYAANGLDISRELADDLGIRRCTLASLWCSICESDYVSARSVVQATLSWAHECGDTKMTQELIRWSGIIAEYEGDYALARECYERTHAMCRGTQSLWTDAWAVHGLGFIATREGELDRAHELLGTSLQQFRERGEMPGILRSLERFGTLAVAERGMRRAARLFGAAEAARREQNWLLRTPEEADMKRDITAARDALGEREFASAWAEGEAMTMERAAEYALEVADQPELLRWPRGDH